MAWLAKQSALLKGFRALMPRRRRQSGPAVKGLHGIRKHPLGFNPLPHFDKMTARMLDKVPPKAEAAGALLRQFVGQFMLKARLAMANVGGWQVK